MLGPSVIVISFWLWECEVTNAYITLFSICAVLERSMDTETMVRAWSGIHTHTNRNH